MIINPMIYVAWAIVLITIGWAATHVHIKKVKIDLNDENTPSELKEAFYEKHPGVKWLTDYLSSVKKFDARLNKSAEKVKSDEKSGFLHKMGIMVAVSAGKDLISQNLDKIEKFTSRKADRVYRKYGSANAATEAMFGNFVEDFLYTSFVLDAFEESKDFETGDYHEIILEAKKRAREIRRKYAT